jgi:hypothetical protein
MMRRTGGLCIGCGALIALNVLAGCAQKQNAAPTAAPQSVEAQLAQAAVTTVSNVVSTATGANRTDRRKIPGAVPMSATGIKRNGRGGYDVSQRQKAALRRAHVYRDRYGVIDRTPKPTTQPTTRPATNR